MPPSSAPRSPARPPTHPKPQDAHAQLHGSFRWAVPADFNIAVACSRRWAAQRPEATALEVHEADGRVARHSYGALQQAADRLTAALVAEGVQAGDRVALVLPQGLPCAVAYIATLQMGAVAVPLSTLFGPEALEFRLHDSGAVLALTDAQHAAVLAPLRAACPGLRGVWSATPCAEADAGWPGEGAPGWTGLPHADADACAVLIYTSGTTGPPKGARIPHRALIGNLTGFVCSQNWFPQDDAVFWSPADWAWTGGLMDALLPTLYFGRTIVATPGRFSPERAFTVMEASRVTHTFLFPTALKAMMKACPQPRQQYRLHLRAVMSAGEAVGATVFAWCQQALGVTVNEMFGQTEINYIVGNCGRWIDTEGREQPGWPARPGSMGKPYPGHRVAVLDDDGNECPPGTAGDVAVHRLDRFGHPDPVFFLGYWRNDAATRAKFTGAPEDSWCRTGDLAVMDEDGYLWYQGRSDDLFKAAGYRIGPSEIENCLVQHPAVANAAVVPKPDAERGALVKAYVVLAPGHAGDAALIEALQQHVRGRLAPYEYPKEIEFIEALPMTTTGKVQRRVLRVQEEERARAAARQGGAHAPAGSASPSGPATGGAA